MVVPPFFQMSVATSASEMARPQSLLLQQTIVMTRVDSMVRMVVSNFRYARCVFSVAMDVAVLTSLSGSRSTQAPAPAQAQMLLLQEQHLEEMARCVGKLIFL